MNVRTGIVCAVLASVAFAGCSGNDATSSPITKATCDELVPKADGTNTAHTKVAVVTTKGNFSIELFDDKSPITAANFKTYVQEKYFDHVVLHRIIKGFMAQGGKFDNSTKTAKTPSHGPIKNEATTSGCHNKKYTLSMARTGDPDSAQTEFFINFADNTFLDPSPSAGAGYAVFGVVYAGKDTVSAIENTPVHVYDHSKDPMCQPESGNAPNCPNTPVEMRSVQIQ